MATNTRKFLTAGSVILAVLLIIGVLIGRSKGTNSLLNTVANAPADQAVNNAAPAPAPAPPAPPAMLLKSPIAGGLSRITKKNFGLKVSPGHSPVSPEKFSGYHTGVDFETSADEQDKEVVITAACSGPLAMKKWATGYGGVAVQHCKLNGEDVTIIYGHLNISSVSAAAGQNLAAGDRIGILGKGYSTETDGERKHLHFGIHKGVAVNIKGYVQSPGELSGWLDPQKYL